MLLNLFHKYMINIVKVFILLPVACFGLALALTAFVLGEVPFSSLHIISIVVHTGPGPHGHGRGRHGKRVLNTSTR